MIKKIMFKDFRDNIECKSHGTEHIKSVYGTISVFCELCTYGYFEELNAKRNIKNEESKNE